MKNDVHLIGSSEPADLSQVTIQAPCGKWVDDAQIVCMFDEVAMGSSIRESLKGVCRKCLSSIGTERYVYGICKGKS